MSTVVKVEIDEQKQEKIYKFVTELVQAKAKEQHHKQDNRKEFKRFFTGFMGEAALEELLDIPIIDWSIGDSSKYHVPDIPGYKVGVKTVEYGKYPIIFKNNWYPQIFCVLDPQEKGTVYVCGLGTKDVLNAYQSDDLILDPRLRSRGTKTGFNGFRHLLPVRSLEDLEKYKIN